MRAARVVAQALQAARSINIVIHQKPDGDALGSAVALAEVLRANKEVTICCVSEVPKVFEQILGQISVEQQLVASADTLVILDSPERHRTGFSRQLPALLKSGKKIVLIDHHPIGDLQKLSSISYVDQARAATAELLYDVLSEMRCAITPKIATSILLGIYTDTGGFRHKTTSSNTLRLASRLIREGGDLQLISRTFCQQLSRPKQRLWGKILSEIQMSRFGIVTAKVSKLHLEEAGSSLEDISGLANLLALTQESRAALVVVETTDGWHGMLRTRHSSVDLGKLARLLGGSGHKKAAGFTTTKRLFSGRIK